MLPLLVPPGQLLEWSIKMGFIVWKPGVSEFPFGTALAPHLALLTWAGPMCPACWWVGSRGRQAAVPTLPLRPRPGLPPERTAEPPSPAADGRRGGRPEAPRISTVGAHIGCAGGHEAARAREEPAWLRAPCQGLELPPAWTVSPEAQAGRGRRAPLRSEGSLPHHGPEMPANPLPERGRPRGHLAVALGYRARPGSGCAGSLEFPGWPEGEGAGRPRRDAERPGGARTEAATELGPPRRPPGLPRPGAAGDQRPLPRSAPPPGPAPGPPRPAPPTPRPHVGAAQSQGRRRARHGLPLLCKYKEGKRRPGAAGERVLRRVGRRLGAAWEPQPNRAGTGTARRRRPRPGPAPASRARAPVAHPGAAECGGVPAAATPGPERPERPEAACGARGRRALHAPRRAPRQPGVRAAAAARAEPRPGPRPAPGGSMSQAELSTCSAPQTQRIFQEAVRKGNTQELQSLLQNMTNCEFNVNSFGPEGQTALHQSVIDGNLELVKLLVKFGADIRLANRDGWSALHIAAFGGHQDIVLYLITKAKYAASGR